MYYKHHAMAFAVMCALANHAHAQSTETPASAANNNADDQQLSTVVVTAKQLDEARNGILTQTGSSSYHIDSTDINEMPMGASTSFNQVLLQAPGVAQDSYGQLHVRGDHADLQYRINGIIIPESISGFGQTLDPRYFGSINLLTGALPAEFGYRTAGVVDIQTNSGSTAPGGEIDLMGGSYGTINPSFQYGGTSGKLDYYVTAQFLHDNLGIENPTDSKSAIHDTTNQGKGFGYLSYLLDDQSRITFMFGTSVGHFQIPNNPDQTPAFPIDGVSAYPNLPSADLNETQREVTNFGVLAYQGHVGSSTDYQVAYFARDTQVDFYADQIGDLTYNGVASDVGRSNFANGIQADASTKLNDSHTLRYGLYTSIEHAVSNNTSSVFLTDNAGDQLPGGPVQIADNSTKRGTQLGVYVQDEWKLFSNLVMNYGVRADRVSAYVNESQISPRLGFVYTPLPQTTVHLSYARYFTPPPTELVAPTDIALFSNTTNAPEITQDDPVKSERDNYFDLGISQKIGDSWTTGLDGYYKNARNLLDEGQFGAALVFSPFNYNSGRVYGVEFTNSYRKDAFGAYLNLAYSKAIATDIVSGQNNFEQDELDYISTHYVHLDHDQRLTGSAGASYDWQGNIFTVDGLYGSGLRAGFANEDHLPAYVTFNFGVAHDFVFADVGRITGRLALINAFDRVYEIRDGSGIGVGAPQYGERRAIFGGISKQF